MLIPLGNKPSGYGASVAAAAGPFNKKIFHSNVKLLFCTPRKYTYMREWTMAPLILYFGTRLKAYSALHSGFLTPREAAPISFENEARWAP
jgi:hypothetical protein